MLEYIFTSRRYSTMRSSKEMLRNLGIAAALTGALGTAACSSSSSPESTSTPPSATASAKANCLTLDSLHLIGGSKSGGENAANTGECAAVSDPATLKVVGEIAAGQSFIIDCEATKPTSFKVETDGGVTGYTNLDGAALQQFNSGAFAAIPAC